MKAKNKVLKTCISAFLVLTLAGCGTGNSNFSGGNTATGKNTSKETGKSSASATTNLEKNIQTSGSVAENGKLIVFTANKNSEPVDMEIEVEFYDNAGVIVGSDSENFTAVGANSEVAVEMYKTPENWANYKIYVDVESTREKSYFNDLQITHSNNGSDIAVQVKNNSNDQIDYITVAVVYYQGEKVVGIEDGIETDIKSGRSANFNIYYAHDRNYRDVPFDSYKVFVTEAYSYNW